MKSIKRTTLSAVSRATLLMVILAVLAQAALAQSDIDFSAEPHALVTQVSDTLFEQINANREQYRNDPDALQRMIEQNFIPILDKTFSARLILGKHSRDLSQDKINAFAEALSNQILERFGDGLLEFDSRDRVEVLPMRGELNDRQTRVQTRVKLNNGKTAPVDYVLRKTDSGWKAFDVIIEGISYVSTYRNQFGARIREDGFDTVLKELQSGELKLEDAQQGK